MERNTVVENLARIFCGLDRAYGLYHLKDQTQNGTKVLGKPATVVGKVTSTLWLRHIMGENGLGIIPIMDGNTCYFGAIDIDVYNGLDHKDVANRIVKNGLPLVPCMSKSGGLHLFCFVNEPVPASLMRSKLSMMAAHLSFGDAEIYPKQDTILTDRGDVANWINMPYFDIESTKRYGIKLDGSAMTIEEFLKEVEAVRWNINSLNAFRLVEIKKIEDGPPCLQHLLEYGFIEGGRNDGLLNLGIYLKKSMPDTWEMALDEYNAKYVNPPLTSADVQSIVKSLRKKEYNYMCNKAPIKSRCNASVCKGRKYGIGISIGQVVLTNLTKYNSQPPIWFVDVEGSGRMELSTEELQNQTRFQRRCMEVLNSMPVPAPTQLWQMLINDLMKNVIIVEAAAEASPKGMLFEFLEKFCTSRIQARNIDEVLIGKPWTDDGFHYFRLSDFCSFLERMRFREFKLHQIASILKEAGGDHQIVKIKGKVINIWKIKMFEMQEEKFNIPKIEDKEVL